MTEIRITQTYIPKKIIAGLVPALIGAEVIIDSRKFPLYLILVDMVTVESKINWLNQCYSLSSAKLVFMRTLRKRKVGRISNFKNFSIPSPAGMISCLLLSTSIQII